MGERLRLFVLLALVVVCAPFSHAFLDPNDPSVKKFIATEDDGFSRAVTSEYVLNRGQSGSVRCKSNQEMVLIKFDLSSLAGQTISEAELHVCASSSSFLYAADVATICVPWSAGTQANNNAAVGDPCWSWRHYPADINNPQPSDYWLPGATNFTFATYGNNGSLACYAYPGDSGFTTYTASTPVGSSTFYRIRLDPDVLHALILDQYGLTLSDTRGYFLQNNTVYTCNQWGGAAGPWLYVKAAATDTTPPGPVTGFDAQPGDWNGQVLLSFVAPTDSGPKGKAFGYDVRYSTTIITDAASFAAATHVDRWRIQRPAAAGTTQKMLVDGLTPNTLYYFAIKAYDQAGNATAMVLTSVALPPAKTVVPFTNGGFAVPAAATSVPTVPNVLRYWAVSDYTKVNPVGGNRLTDGYTSTANDGYKKGNPVWDAANTKVVLKAARNEVASFQVILEKLAAVTSLTNVKVNVSDLTGPGTIAATPNIELFRTWYLNTGGAWYPQACIPLKAPFATSFAIPNANNAITGQANQSVWVDIYVPKGTPVGTYTGTITVTADQLTQPLQIGVQLTVRWWQLPDQPTFIVDLNGYGAPWSWGGSAAQLSYYQLAQKNRQIVDTVIHSHTLNSAANGYSARMNDPSRMFTLTGDGANLSVTSWNPFDSSWSSYLDGTAFSAANGYNGPGMNTPISMLFLPFFESYPLSSYWWYDATGLGGPYWYGVCPGPNDSLPYLSAAPDPMKAYPTSYETGLKTVVKGFMEHAQAMGWHGTNFQYFHNNKNQYGSAANPHSQFWNMDEPSEGDCMRALGYFHGLWREAAEAANAPDVKRSYRIDTSDRTGMTRGQMDGKVSLWDCSGIDDYHNLVPGRKLNWPDEMWWYYGGGSASSGNETTVPKRFLQVWAWYLDGALPYWDCYSNQNSWTSEGDPYPVFMSGQSVPGQTSSYNVAIPTVRMKEMRRGQQDVEYLACLAKARGWSRAAVIRAMQAKYADTGGQAYSGMNELSFFKLREDVAATVGAPGDANGDGHVNVADLQLIVACWGTSLGDAAYNSAADLNGDGHVNIGDLQVLVANWGV